MSSLFRVITKSLNIFQSTSDLCKSLRGSVSHTYFLIHQMRGGQSSVLRSEDVLLNPNPTKVKDDSKTVKLCLLSTRKSYLIRALQLQGRLGWAVRNAGGGGAQQAPSQAITAPSSLN